MALTLTNPAIPPEGIIHAHRSLADNSFRIPLPWRPVWPRSRPEARSPMGTPMPSRPGPMTHCASPSVASRAAGWNTSPAGANLKDTRITTICDIDLNVTGRATEGDRKAVRV